MSFVAGDIVVHPQHGTAVVEGVVVKDTGHGPTEYLELHMGSPSLTVLLPTESVEQAGLRSLTSREEAEEILDLLGGTAEVPVEWVERNTSTAARMKSRELDQVAMVVRDLTRHQQRIGKPLNMGEQSALNAGLSMLARELSLSLDIPEDEMLALLVARAAGVDEAAAGTVRGA